MDTAPDPAVLVYQYIAASTSGDSTSDYSSQLAQLWSGKTLSLLQFIQTLGPTLTSEDVSTRVISLQCFANTLAEVDSAVISKQDVGVLLQFLTSKLEDEKLSSSTLNALASLVKAKNFIPHVNNNLKDLISAVIKDYDPRKHLAKVRYEAFLLLEAIVEKHQDTLATNEEFAECFVNAFIHVASGEKDPRNLLLSFKLNAEINTKIPFQERSSNKTHDELLSDLFDVCFCYFPISFTTPENDPYKITALDLKKQLRITIASQPQFSRDAFPSLFEKLTSTNPAVRNDVLQCLLLCVNNYPAEVLEQYWLSIWDALKFEILHNDILTFQPEADFIIPPNYESLEETDDNKTLILTLVVLNSLIQKLTDSEMFPSIMDTVLQGLEANYKSLVGKTLKPAVLLLSAMGSSSVTFFNRVVDTLFSFEVWGHYIRSDYQEDTEEDKEIDIVLTTAKQRDLIDNLGYVLTAQKLLGVPTNLEIYKDHILIFMGQLLQTSSNIEKSLKCKIVLQLTKLVVLDTFLSADEVSLVLTWFSENIKALIEDSSAKGEPDVLLLRITKSLTQITSEGPEESIQYYINSVITIILPPLLERVSQPLVLSVINQICLNYQFLEVLSIRYLNKLSYEDCDEDLSINLIESLIFSFKQAQSVRPFLATSWYSKFFPRFFTISQKRFADNVYLLEISGSLLGLIVRFCDKTKHEQILHDMIDLFFEGKTLDGFNFEFEISKPSAKISLLKHILANIDRNCSISDESVDSITKQLINLIPNIEDQIIRLEYLQVLAVVINKLAVNREEQVEQILSDLSPKSQFDQSSFELSIWIAKGLLVRVSPRGVAFLNKLVLDLSNNPDLDYCRLILRSFNVLAGDVDVFSNDGKAGKIISGVTNLNVKILYKQQIFEICSPKLISDYSSSEKEEKSEIFLSTLSILIQNVSAKVINPHLEAILPLVLNGLYSHNSCILEASLQTLDTAITQSPELVKRDMESLVKKLVSLGTTKIVINKKVVNKENIRLLSLDCLIKIFTEFEEAKVRGLQVGLTQALAPGHDDKKRSVRKKTTDLCQLLHEMDR